MTNHPIQDERRYHQDRHELHRAGAGGGAGCAVAAAQVHDELVFECPADEAERICDPALELMPPAMALDVPLKVEVKRVAELGDMELLAQGVAAAPGDRRGLVDHARDAGSRDYPTRPRPPNHRPHHHRRLIADAVAQPQSPRAPSSAPPSSAVASSDSTAVASTSSRRCPAGCPSSTDA
ncbi:MAG: hypothetical protein U0531_12750 [Dehalococcoidia bacterium]